MLKNKLKEFSFLIVPIFIFAIILPFLPLNVSANDKYKTAIATASGYNTVVEYNSYQEAFNALDKNNPNAIILLGDTIVFVTSGVGYINNINDTITLTSASHSGNYISGLVGSFGGDVAPIDYNPSNKTVKIKINALTGYIPLDKLKLVPSIRGVTPHYYNFGQTSVSHYLKKQDQTTLTSFSIGPNLPEYGLSGSYYSYDGKFFYPNTQTGLVKMLKDYRENHNNNAVNKNNPYYNYYLYLPTHSRSNYSPGELENSISKLSSSWSLLKGEGISFYLGQEYYGYNALLSLGLSRNESGNGSSGITAYKLNAYGHNAVDSDPANSAQSNPTIRTSIFSHAKTWGLYRYSAFWGTNYNGPSPGNANVGHGVRYAADPYWSEKTARYAYSVETGLGNELLDHNFYQLAVKTGTNTVYAQKSPSDQTRITYNGKTYHYKTADVSILIVGEETYGGNTYYKIVSDANLDKNKNIIPNGTYENTRFDFENSYVYVLASSFKKINNTTYKDLSDANVFDDINYKYVDYLYEGTTLRLGETLKSVKGSPTPDSMLNNIVVDNYTQVAKGSRLILYGHAEDLNGNIISYLAGTNTAKTEKSWINANDIKLVSGKIGQLQLLISTTGANARTDTKTGSGTLSYNSAGDRNYVYGSVAFEILDERNANGYDWVQLKHEGNTSGDGKLWIIKQDPEQKVNITNYVITNSNPIINASNKTLIVGNEFNPLSGVTATDAEDGTITSKIIIVENNVNNNEAGTYTIKYSVTDKDNNVTTKTITVTVNNKTSVDASFYLEYFKVENNKLIIKGYNATKGFAMTDPSKVSFKIRFNSLDTSETYDLDLETITNKNEMTRKVNINDKVDYTYAWYKGEVDFVQVPDGNYQMEIITETDKAVSVGIVSNVLYNEQITTFTKSGKVINTSNNYNAHPYPVEVFIRSNNNLVKNNHPWFNQFGGLDKINWEGNKLALVGTAFSYNMNLSNNITVSRNLVIENITTKETFTYALKTLTKGPFNVVLPTNDNLSKDQAWYDEQIDLTTLPKGKYALYVSVKSNKSDFSYLSNPLRRDLANLTKTINDKTYTFSMNSKLLERVELTIS